MFQKTKRKKHIITLVIFFNGEKVKGFEGLTIYQEKQFNTCNYMVSILTRTSVVGSSLHEWKQLLLAQAILTQVKVVLAQAKCFLYSKGTSNSRNTSQKATQRKSIFIDVSA